MYVNPGTNIRLLNNVPLDDTYNHTIYFDSSQAQYTYFVSKQKYNLQRYTYQRVRKGVARVGIVADDIYDCNYMMFQNASFGPKWFYAFIRNIEYINNECSEITFELDVMQSWLFAWTPGNCFVEREHTANDVIGQHIEPEPIALGEYVLNNYQPLELGMDDMSIIIAIVDTDEPFEGRVYDGVYGSATLWAYSLADEAGINAKLDTYQEKTDAILSIYMIPTLLLGNKIPDDHRIKSGSKAITNYIGVDKVKLGDTLSGYTPRNNKMYTYPYTYLHVDNSNGSALALRYEFFSDPRPVLEVAGTVTEPIEISLRPCTYKGVRDVPTTGNYRTLNTESLTLNNFPMCSWAVDTYKAWLAQNSIPMILEGVGAAGKMAVDVASSPIPQTAAISAAGSAITSVASIATQFYRASIAADMSKGTFDNGGVNTANKKNQFYYGRASVTAQHARMIDDFFTMFGYAVKRVKTPNRNARPHWNYVKTISAVFTGSVPADDMRKICQIHDNGITYWKNGDEIGNYTLDNSP